MFVIIICFMVLIVVLIISYIAIKELILQLDKSQKMSDKHLELFELMSKWVNIKQEGKNLSLYFEEKDYYRIAIYGMSYVGKALENELKNTDINIVFCIDQNLIATNSAIRTHCMADDWEAVDAIVVTPIAFFDEIKAQLEKKVNCPIVAIDDILYEV